MRQYCFEGAWANAGSRHSLLTVGPLVRGIAQASTVDSTAAQAVVAVFADEKGAVFGDGYADRAPADFAFMGNQAGFMLPRPLPLQLSRNIRSTRLLGILPSRIWSMSANRDGNSNVCRTRRHHLGLCEPLWRRDRLG